MDDLDKMLNMRQRVPQCIGLEERIIFVSQPPVMAFIMLPRPVLMMVFLLVCGLGLGLYGVELTAVDVDFVELLLDEESIGEMI